jgi:hypothetical protein
MHRSTFANISTLIFGNVNIMLGLWITQVQVLEGNRRINFIFVKHSNVVLQRGQLYNLFFKKTSVQASEVNGRINICICTDCTR